jgi:hypothetical protein
LKLLVPSLVKFVVVILEILVNIVTLDIKVIMVAIFIMPIIFQGWVSPSSIILVVFASRALFGNVLVSD